MTTESYRYVIVGGGFAAASAVEGIRAHDSDGTILLLSRENYAPYQRPPLSKGLWFGKNTLDDLPIHDEAFYEKNGVTLGLRREIEELDADGHTLWDDRGIAYRYEKLLLATGARPRRIGADGSNLEDVRFYRSLEDYLLLTARIEHVQHVLVVGGGYIGIEMAAALRESGREVTYLYPREYPLHRVLPRDLGLFVAEYYRGRGIETVSNQTVASFANEGGLLHARTVQGDLVTTQLAVVGVGAEPNIGLAEGAGLEVGNGIEVDEHARTSHPDVYAAGDVAEFPYLALGRRTRVEHWDHAEHHGRLAGANMAGEHQVYDHMPFFYSDFFDLGWEAVGDLDIGFRIEAVWKEPNREGVLYYLNDDDEVRGVMLWNVWERVDWARDLIRARKPMTRAELEQAANLD